MMDISFSNELCYMSASSCNQDQNLFFYSAPTSPSQLKFIEHNGSQTGPTTPRSYEDANSNIYGFEFETSRRFSHSEPSTKTNRKEAKAYEQNQRHCEDSLPTMAFADELFCEGKVMPMMPPLKLPPRLVHNGDSTQSSRATSPKSPGSMLRLPFTRLWKNDDDFDPFKVALEKVREENREKPKDKQHGIRRTRSLSPLRGVDNKCDKHVGQSESYKHDQSHFYEKFPLLALPKAQLLSDLLEEPLYETLERENTVSESKELVIARQVRRVDNDTNLVEFEPKRTLVSNVAKETKKDEKKRGGFWTKNKKIECIKKFFFGNSNKGKASNQHKLEDKKTELRKHTSVKKLDMKSVTSTESTTWSKDEISGEFNKMRLVCHKPLPKSLLCLDYERWKVKWFSHPLSR
ncbi:hypothetical protein TSUD_251630 [Trifolium subterraneum]|uniref:Uncharacterized protein n=1 Tax=Trifolium subterraneum TaxID=3900 RepID=A0A2Z6MGI8_TRISU|nr:hypothetical protein TSUD_251630 [Trifolium subterraneum]